MSRRPRVLIVNTDQFGYHTDTYSYCRHLRQWYDITYMGWEFGFPPVSVEGVKTVHVSRGGGKLARTRRLVAAARREIRTGGHDVVFVVYFRGCSLVPLGVRRIPIVMDVRSGCIHASPVVRRTENVAIRWESGAYRYLTVISESLRKYLRLDPARSTILPLGGEDWGVRKARTSAFRLLYVGTLNFRNIDRTVDAFGRFCRANGDGTEMFYEIVGGGDNETQQRLREAIDASGCSQRIVYRGKIPYPEIPRFFEWATAGVAFVPLVEYFDNQPVTKVFEYFLAGMPVIATSTFETCRFVNTSNGVLCDDTVEGFEKALQTLFERRVAYDPSAIQADSARFSWASIVRSTLKPYLDSLISADRLGDGR